LNALMHMTLRIAGNALLASRRTCAAAATAEVSPGGEFALGTDLPAIVKQSGFKLLDASTVRRQSGMAWEPQVRRNHEGASSSTGSVKHAMFMVSCFES
jgi:hypothetical protein